MKKSKQKIRAVVAVAMMLICCLPSLAYHFEVDGVYYEITSTTEPYTVAVTYKDTNYNSYSGDVTIPETVTYNNVEYTVSLIKSRAFSKCIDLKSVVIPSTIVEIQSTVFSGCSGLTSVTIPSSITSIPGYTFSGCSSLTSIEIPSSVTSINGSAFSGCSGLTSIEIPNSVTSIDSSVFQGCSGLASIVWNAQNSGNFSTPPFSDCPVSSFVFGESVEYIPEYLCSELTNLTEISIPNSVTSIGGYAFFDSGLTSVEIPNSVTYIGSSCFENCTGLTSVEIPNSVTSIGDYAFSNCGGLTSIEIPNSVTSIGNQTFFYCKGLTSIEIPNSVTSIGESAFSNCSGLTSVVLGNSFMSIGQYAFGDCSNIIEVYISDLNSYCNISFGNEYANPVHYASRLYLNGELIENLEIPDGITKINSYLFYGLEHIKSVKIPDSVTSIGSEAFSQCNNVTNVTLGNSVKEISDWAFNFCSIKNIDFPESLETIGERTFEGNDFSSIDLPEGVTSIGELAFNQIFTLKGMLTLPSTLTSIGNNAFSGDYTVCRVKMTTPLMVESFLPSSVKTLIVPAGTKEAYASAAVWGDIETIIEEGSSIADVTVANGENLSNVLWREYYDWNTITDLTVHGTLTDTDINLIKTNATSLLNLDISDTDCTALPANAFADRQTLLSIVLPDGLEEIGDNAFSGCNALSNALVIPQSVRKIGNSAFRYCYNLPSVELPEDLAFIGTYAFEQCTSLESITLPNSVTLVGAYAFQSCRRLSSAVLSGGMTSIPSYMFKGCNSLSSVVIPTGLTRIEAYAFYDCWGLTSLDLTNCESLTSIGQNAFYNCYSIETINFPSSLTSIGTTAFSGCTALKQMSIPTEIPPTISTTAAPFEHVDNLACVLSIPKDSEYAYYESNYWGGFIQRADRGNIDVEIELPSTGDSASGDGTTGDGSEDGSGSGSGSDSGETDGSDTGTGNDGQGGGKHHHHHGCHIHFHKGKHDGGPKHLPGLMRAAAETTTEASAVNAVTYSGSRVYVSGEEYVTFVITLEEGYLIKEVLYGNDTDGYTDVTDQLVDNTYTTPAAEVKTTNTLKVTLEGSPVVSYTLGDADNSGEINVTDAVATINHIMGTTAADAVFVEEAADVNEDGAINVTDVVAIMNSVLNVSESASAMPMKVVAEEANKVVLSAVEAGETEIRTINAELVNDVEFTAFQADLQLPEGIELQDVVLSDRASKNHTISYSLQADGSYRIISMSMSNKGYAGNEGVLFSIMVKNENPEADAEVKLNNILFTTPQAVGYEFDEAVLEIGGTTSVTSLPIATRIYADGQSIVVEAPEDCMSIISGIDGIVRTVETKAGRNEYAMPTSGLYIVCSGSKVVKVIIK